jgi:hypothetical protein
MAPNARPVYYDDSDFTIVFHSEETTATSAPNAFYLFFQRLEKEAIFHTLTKLGYTRVADIATADPDDLRADAGCGIVIAKLLIREAQK